MKARSVALRVAKTWISGLLPVVLLAALPIWSSAGRAAVPPAKAAPPNVLFIILDDMNGYGSLGEYPGVKMPYMDAFKARSLTFSKTYAACPKCVPSRTSTLSGLYPHTTGAYLNTSNPWQKSEALKRAETLPEYFKRMGYETFGRGKIFHVSVGNPRGKDMWDNDAWTGGFGPFPDKEHQLKGNFWGVQALPDQEFPDAINSDAALQFLASDHAKPFFLALGIYRPHTPFTAPQRFFDLYDPKEIQIPAGYRADDLNDVPAQGKAIVDPLGRFPVSGATTPDEWKKMIRAYLACNSFSDWSFGRVIEALARSRYAGNTLIVLWSDNGYHCGEKNHWEKSTLWEQATHVPMVISIPGMKTGGKICPRPVSLVDLYPTLVDYCGLGAPRQKLDGLSLRPFIEKPERELERPVLSVLFKNYASVRDDRFRYIRYEDGSEELYDHDQDRYEFANLAGNPSFAGIKTKLGRSVPIAWNAFEDSAKGKPAGREE